MKTKAVRLYDAMDLRLEEFELPRLENDQILAEVITDSLCMSTYKAIAQGTKHKKVPNDINENPIILGHEFCGIILEVGEKWKDQYKAGDKFVIQPNIGDLRGFAPGYSFPYVGGDATKIIFQNEVMENGSLLKYNGDSFYEGSLVEPLSCVVGAFHAQYHMKKMYSYEHVMGIKEGGTMAILGATGPMGLLAIDLAIHGDKKPSLLVITGRTQSKLDFAAKNYSVEEAKKNGVTLIYVNTSDMDAYAETLRGYTKDNYGFDDVFIFAPDENMVTQGVDMLAYDGCLNFFSGPADSKFSSRVNFYNIHYNSTHFVGTSGGNTDDMKEAIQLIEDKRVNVAKIATHILGLDHVVETTKNLPNLSGSKKIVYTGLSLPLIEVDKLNEISDNTIGNDLLKIVESNNHLWSAEAERYLMANAPKM